MSSSTPFFSSLAEVMADFIAFKQMQGYDYTAAAKRLRWFDRFLVEEGITGNYLCPVSLNGYVAATAHLNAGTRENRFSAVRQFSRYLHAYCPQSAILPSRILPKRPRRPRFYPLDPDQIRQLMDEAARLCPKHAVRAECIRFLIGFLYATGLRIGEALKLNVGNVDMEQDTVFVHQGKFGKDRLVAMTGSTCRAVAAWLKLRSHYAASGPSAPFLVGSNDTRLTYDQAYYMFKVLRRRCGFTGDPLVRLHDLRHNFACHCIARWRAEGRNVQALLPALVNAMGHVSLSDTQVYIHAREEELRQASDRFAEHVSKAQEQSR